MELELCFLVAEFVLNVDIELKLSFLEEFVLNVDMELELCFLVAEFVLNVDIELKLSFLVASALVGFNDTLRVDADLKLNGGERVGVCGMGSLSVLLVSLRRREESSSSSLVVNDGLNSTPELDSTSSVRYLSSISFFFSYFLGSTKSLNFPFQKLFISMESILAVSRMLLVSV